MIEFLRLFLLVIDPSFLLFMHRQSTLPFLFDDMKGGLPTVKEIDAALGDNDVLL